MATIGGKWVGLGLGDADPEVGRIRDFMRRKFVSYAGNLPSTINNAGIPLFDEPMTVATLTMQRAYAAQGKLDSSLVNGYIGASTKVVMGYLPATTIDIRPLLFTVCGTGVPWWVGPDADTARACPQFLWQPIGYPANAVPMGPSIKAGHEELVNQFNIHREQVERCGANMAGYSQGAVITAEVWEQEIRDPAGRLHWALPFMRKAVAWGNPNREVGKVYPDFAPGETVAPPNTGGVTGTRMTDTPDWWRNYAHAGDLYGAGWTGDNAASQDKIAIWHIIRDTNFFSGPDSLLSQFLEIAKSPLVGAIGAFTAMFDALRFFGQQTAPHTDYNIGPAIDYLRS
jgi:hypothetical protein